MLRCNISKYDCYDALTADLGLSWVISSCKFLRFIKQLDYAWSPIRCVSKQRAHSDCFSESQSIFVDESNDQAGFDMTDKQRMKEYWHEIGAGDKANWHIAHIDDENEFFRSGPHSVNLIFDGKLEDLATNANILDIGCGRGRVARSVAEFRPDVRVYGVDVAPSMIAGAMEANKHIQNLSFSVGDGISLSSFPDGVFDFVYSFIVFQHLPRHITAQYIADAARVLKPGGQLVFQVQQRDEPMIVDPQWNNFRTIRFYTAEQAVSLVAPPLSVVKTRGGGHDFFVEAVRE